MLLAVSIIERGEWDMTKISRSRRRITGAYPSLLETEEEILGIQLSDLEMWGPVVEINL